MNQASINMDPDSLIAIAIMYLSEHNSWENSIEQLTQLIFHLRQTQNLQLDPPYADLSDTIIFVSIPEVVKKCLELPNCTVHNYPIIANFLKEVIFLAKASFIIRNSPQLVPLLFSIIDDAEPFHVHRPNQNQTRLTIMFARFMVDSGIPDALLSLFPLSTFEIDDFVWAVALFYRISLATAPQPFATDYQNAIQIICDKLETLATRDDNEQRKIPFKQVLDIIKYLILIDTDEAVRNVLMNIMMSFLDIDIIDIKLSGIKIGVILFTNVLTNDLLNEPQFTGIFTYLLNQTESNLEALTLLQPALVKYIETNLVNEEIIDTFFQSIINVPPSVIQKAYTLFSDVALKATPKSEASYYVLQKVLHPPNIDLLTKLVVGPQYTNAALGELFKLAEDEKNRLALDAIIKVAPLVDLSLFVPMIADHIGDLDFFKDHVILIEKLLKKTMVHFDISLITAVLAKNVQTFSQDDISEIMKSLSEILRATNQKIPKDDLVLIFNNAPNNECLIKIIEYLFLERYELITPDSTQVLFDLIHRASESVELFPILRHLYLTGPNMQIKNAVSDSLLNAILYPLNDVQRLEVSQLLLTFNDPLIIPNLIYKYVKLCLDTLSEKQNLNAALFINECLSFTTKYVLIEKFKLQPHRFVVPEDLLTVNIEIPKSETPHLQVSINNHVTVGYLITVLSGKLERDVTSIILYSKGKSVPPTAYITDTDLAFEVRFKDVYDCVPQFTLENHPVSLFNNEKYIERLLGLLDSEIGEQIYNILINIPTPKGFSITKLGIDPSKPYLFLYELHFLAKHLNELVDKAKLQSQFEQIICEQFETIIPETRYLLLLLLDSNTTDERLVTKVMYSLCIEKAPRYFVRIMRKLWSIVSNFEIDLDVEILKAIVFKENAKFNELAMKSHLIQTQKFEKIWSVYRNFDDENKLKSAKILTKIHIPAEFYQEVFTCLLPLFIHLDESILAIFAELSEKWPEFPPDSIATILIDSYIKCTNKPQSISDNPFKLILSIMENNETIRNEIIDQFSQIPVVTEWNYTPIDSFKCNGKCGLNNLGATCYANSVLQQIFNIEPIRNFIISNESFIDPSMQALHVLFTKMMYSQRKFIHIEEFASQWTGWDGLPIQPKEQQDANEFLMLLFSRLELYPEAYSLFSGESETVFTDRATNTIVSKQKTDFTNLPLIVSGQNSIEQSMKLAQIPEVIDNYKVDDKSQPISVESTNIINTLPPYLFIQLKRFDYSIETQTRIKIDQKFEFEDIFDFKQFTKFEGETKYRLIGVVLHQGEVDVGHYYSYTRLSDNQWLCLNDTGVSIVCDNIMKNETYGSPTGSTGYLLVYERFDAAELSGVPLTPDHSLLEAIQKDNLDLIVNSVYFTPYFARFVNNLITHLDFKNESINRCIFRYTLNSLVHTSLSEPFENIVDTIIQSCRESPEITESFGSYLQDEINCIIEILTQCPNKAIKYKFCDLIAEFVKLQDSTLIIIISAQLPEWYPIILQNWRNGFDFFKLFTDFASIGEEPIAYMHSGDIVDSIFSFVQNDFKPYVDNKDNKVTFDRFIRLIDMTWIFRFFEAVHVPMDKIIKPSFMKWCLASEKHCPALLELIKSEIPRLEIIAKQSKSVISESLITALTMNSPIPFIIPASWIPDYLRKKPAQIHVFRAITDMVGVNFDLFEKFALQQNLFYYFLTATQILSEDNIIFLKKLEDNFRSDHTTMIKYTNILFFYVQQAPTVSRSLYQINPQCLNTKPAQSDLFQYLPFLTYISELSARIDNLKDYVPIVSQALFSIVDMNPMYDEHAFTLAKIGCLMMRDEKNKNITEVFATDIFICLQFMMNHQSLPSTLRLFILGLIAQYNNTQLPTSVLIPNDPIGSLICNGALSKEPKPYKAAAIELLKMSGKRYASASRALKFIFANLGIVDLDVPACYEILSEYSLEVINTNYPLFDNNTEAIYLIITQFYQIKDKIDIMMKMSNILSLIARNSPGKFRTATSLTLYRDQMNNLCRFCSDNRNHIEGRLSALSILRVWIESVNFNPYESFQPGQIILNHFEPVNNPETQELLDKFTAALINAYPSNDSIRERVVNELFSSFNLATVGDERFNTLHSMMSFQDDDLLLNQMVELKLLQKIWSMKFISSNNVINGLLQLTAASKPFWDSETEKELSEIAKQVNPQYSTLLLNIINES